MDVNDKGSGDEPFHQHEKVVRDEVQVGWRHMDTGVMCDCPVYERSPHANSEPVMVPREVADRIRTMHLPTSATTPHDSEPEMQEVDSDG